MADETSHTFDTADGTFIPSGSPNSCPPPLQECTLVCPSNLTSFQESLNKCESDDMTVDETITLKFLTATWADFIRPLADQFSQERPGVNVELVIIELSELSPNIINEARSKTGLFDGFITPPGVMGSIVEENGWADLRSHIESSAITRSDWLDIFLSYRKWIAQYQDQILMYPLDGDVLSLFYRQDILDEFGLSLPRTWEEYNQIAGAVHGKVFKNQTLIGSCIGRLKGCGGAYWANLVLSSMTQYRGTWDGHLFDTADMTPLLGEAFEKMLEILEIQARYGPEDEFEACVDLNSGYMNDGSCVLSYNWGNTFKQHLNDESVFRMGDARMSVCQTPGSTQVLDRQTMKLVPCDKDRCRFGEFYDDIGWVNRAPYLAFGGWSCAVNNYTTPGKTTLATEFCAYASSRAKSNPLIVEDAKTAVGGSDPFRRSQLDVDQWVANGYHEEAVVDYFNVISEALESDNVVVDIRFPTSSEIYALLDLEVHDYLNATRQNVFSGDELSKARRDLSQSLARHFQEIINEYDSKASTRHTALEQYQKLRNVYQANNSNLNQLGNGIRGYGFAIASLTMVLAGIFAFWSYKNRLSPVVKASQPLFLILICLGVFVMASSIFPMAMDDGFASEEACDKACMAIPWLMSMGWSILFAALYAKLRRLNIVVRNALAFRSIKVSEKDVMLPFAVLFTSNLILMTVWTLVDPLTWTRIETSPTESFGACRVDDESSVSWKVIVSFVAVLNGAALIGANLEAYKARHVDTEFGESRYIGLIMGSYLQVVAVGLPLFFLVNDNPTARFFLTSSMVFLMCSSVLLLLFIPKWRTAMQRGQNQPIMFGVTSRDRNDVTGFNTTVMSNRQSEDTALSRGNHNSPTYLRYDDAVWTERVTTLEALFKDAGIDAKPYLIKANMIDQQDHIVGISGVASYSGLSIPAHFMGRSSVESSLAPISEVEKDNGLLNPNGERGSMKDENLRTVAPETFAAPHDNDNKT
ncbi:7 transmembrane sweet-taste receptor of 3 GCPR [Nitzschia inconspicua]|uniref:7 transmembrane sweet-taste receptor of 3 GCPR n=1 Tax=Nitzschia inconspicua TaxID=303405 RepID=A0A9K3LU71_9STRA|nr:7 transmembrane sweet-taste receptor of 3 GCPR [Nitzschia inconspicua]